MILLIVTIGLVNVCMGLGLAIYFGYGPPTVDAILQSLERMPKAPLSIEMVLPGSNLGAPYDPFASDALAIASTDSTPSASEETVLADIQELAGSVQSPVTSSAANAH